VKKFSFGNAAIVPPSATGDQQRKAGFFRSGSNHISPLVKNAPLEVRQELMQQEDDLNEISNILGDLHGIATTMGGELGRQSEQLDRVTGRVDIANDRLHKTNHRIDRLL